MINDREQIVGNAEYIKSAVKDDAIRKQIVDEYFAVLDDEAQDKNN